MHFSDSTCDSHHSLPEHTFMRTLFSCSLLTKLSHSPGVNVPTPARNAVSPLMPKVYTHSVLYCYLSFGIKHMTPQSPFWNPGTNSQVPADAPTFMICGTPAHRVLGGQGMHFWSQREGKVHAASIFLLTFKTFTTAEIKVFLPRLLQSQWYMKLYQRIWICPSVSNLFNNVYLVPKCAMYSNR